MFSYIGLVCDKLYTLVILDQYLRTLVRKCIIACAY